MYGELWPNHVAAAHGESMKYSVASIEEENLQNTGYQILYTDAVPRTYDQIVPYAFKRFSLLRALKTGIPTLQYELARWALAPSAKPALFTMNILPPMMTVWHHFVRKELKDRVDVVIFDSSGKLDPSEFPGARVQKFLNLYAATKSEKFLRSIARNRRIGWLCDDDMFIINGKAVDVVEHELAVPNTASVSFRPRHWWEFDIDGKRHPVSSSYCIAYNREIFVEKEHLSLKPCDGNTHPPIGQNKHPERYDTCDKANEILLKKGYRCAIVPEEERETYVTGFSGLSGAVMLLAYFTKPQQTLDFFLTPPKERWRGNMLYGLLSAMLAICTITELAERIRGKTYPLASLPSRTALEKIRSDHEQFLREGQSFAWVDTVSETLRTRL